jgi:mannan endo-1,4-beta-mannosidase
MRGGARTWFRTVPGRALLSLVPLVLAGGVIAASAGGLTPRPSSPSVAGPAKGNAASALAPRHLTTSSEGGATTSSTSSSTTSPTTATTGTQTAQNESAHSKAAVPATSPPTTQAVAPPSTTTTSTDPPIPAGVIGVSDGHLELNEQPYTFVGVNAYEIGTEFGVNPGCGSQETDTQLNELFSSLPPNSLVRIWAFQDAIATNVQTDQLDWAPLDRVFAAAAAHGQRLIVTLTDQGGVCDGDHWQDPAWYEGGFMDVFNSASNSDGSGHTPLSYWDYMQDVVNRYKNSPALGMWEPISEAEASTCDGDYYPGTCWGHTSCPDEAVAAAALRHFFDVVGGEIHSLDPNHLVENGLLGGGQCGTESGDYEYVSASPGVDVLSYHDYYAGTPMGGDQWNGIGVRIAQAAALSKPIIAGETGLDAGTAPGCMTLAARSSEIQAKIQTQMKAGASGVLIWDWLPAPSSPCTTDTFPGDPLMAVVAAGPPSS